MSHGNPPVDTQALLQSMLQKLKLQPGAEGHINLQTSVVDAPAPVQHRKRGSPTNQESQTSPPKVFDFNGSNNFGYPSEKLPKQSGPECDALVHSPTSFPSFHLNAAGNRSKSWELQQASHPGVIPPGTGQLLPVASPKDIHLTSFRWTQADTSPIQESIATQIPNKDQNMNEGFAPKVYGWSLTNNSTTGHRESLLGNGESVGLDQSKDAGFVSGNQKLAIGRRKQRSSENKTRRWTQRFKERWKDKQGSAEKKEKGEESSTGDKTGPQTHVQMGETLNPPNPDEGKSFSSFESERCPAQTDDITAESSFRSTGDFQIGLGSFSLLEEITMGQEWAKFINPNHSTIPANQETLPATRPPVQLHSPNNNNNQPSVSPFGAGSFSWRFSGAEPTNSVRFKPMVSPETSLPMRADLKEGERRLCGEAERSELMEHDHSKTDVQAGLGLQQRDCCKPHKDQPDENVHNVTATARSQTSRKRQHQQPTETMRVEGGMNAGFVSSLRSTSGFMMSEALKPQQHNNALLGVSNSQPPPLRGVLRHMVSQESEGLTAVNTKRRRVEENRRVHFADKVVTIASPDAYLLVTDSEEDSFADDDTVSNQSYEVEQMMSEEVAPPRRARPATWIKALMRKNTKKKQK